MVKINFDASFNRHEHNSVSRIVFRDNEGYILAVCTYSNSFVVDPTTTEVRACLQAVTVAKDLGLWRLVVEGDSLTIVKKIQSLGEERSNIAMIIK